MWIVALIMKYKKITELSRHYNESMHNARTVQSGFALPLVIIFVALALGIGGGAAYYTAQSPAKDVSKSTPETPTRSIEPIHNQVTGLEKKSRSQTKEITKIQPPVREEHGTQTKSELAFREPVHIPSAQATAEISSLPIYDRVACADSSEGDKIFIRNGVRYRADDETRRWAEEFCGPNARTPLFTVPPSSASSSQSSMTPKPTCESSPSPVFTNHITDMSKVNYIGPPPTMGAGPSLKPHSYIGTDHVRVPVYAPTAITLQGGAHYIGGPYMMDFKASCEVTIRFGHITEPVDAIKQLLPSEPKDDSRTQNLAPVVFAAGELLGYTTGTDMAGNWDFGVYNSATSNRYAADPDWSNSATYTTAVCPFDYFTPDLKSAYTSKFNSTAMAGNPPHGEPFCH